MDGRLGLTQVLVAVAALVCAGNMGCHHAFDSKVWTHTAWALDEQLEVSLDQKVAVNSVFKGPEYNYAEVWLALSWPEGVRQHEGVMTKRIARREFGPGESPARIISGDVIARAAAARQRVWFVEQPGQRVVASLDRQTKPMSATGPDDKPAPWAQPEEGIVLSAGHQCSSRE